jgi:small neutral amino acid transporter SnatA (MarC family)
VPVYGHQRHVDRDRDTPEVGVVRQRPVGSAGYLPRRATHRRGYTALPLATPLIAGLGTIGATILLTAEARGDFALQLTVIAALLAVLAMTFLLLMAANQVEKALGVTKLELTSILMIAGMLMFCTKHAIISLAWTPSP